MSDKKSQNNSDDNKTDIEDATSYSVQVSESAESEEPVNAPVSNTDDEGANAFQPPEDKNQQEKKTKTGALWFFAIFNFLLIIGLVAGGAYAYYHWQQNQGDGTDELTVLKTELVNANADIQKLERQLNNTGSALNNQLTSALAEQDSSIAQQSSALDSELANVSTLVQQNAEETNVLKRKVSELSGRRPADWLLAEADYLVRMAGRKLYLEKDVSSAMLMLQAADARLADLADPSLFPVRKLIANDIQSLHQVNPVSTNSVALALNGMLIQVDQLPLNALKIPEFEENEAADRLSDDVADWQENLSKTWDAIRDDFIQVETSNEPILPYLSTKQRWLITEQLKLAIAQAQSAATNERETLYQASIQQAMAIVVEHFQLDDTKVKQYLEALQQLSATEVAKDYPRELNSTQALKDLIDERVKGVFGNELLDDEVNSESEQQGQEQTSTDEGVL